MGSFELLLFLIAFAGWTQRLSAHFQDQAKLEIYNDVPQKGHAGEAGASTVSWYPSPYCNVNLEDGATS